MRIVHDSVIGRIDAAWRQGGWREKAGLLAGAYCAAFVGATALGYAGGWGTSSLLSKRMHHEIRRVEVLEETLIRELKGAKKARIRPEEADARYLALRAKTRGIDRELDRLETMRKRRGVDDKSLEAGIRAAVSPLLPVVMMNAEKQRADLEKHLGREFPGYRLLFNLHYAISDYLTYRNTSGNVIPRSMKAISDSASGDCKDHSAMLASLALASGFRVKYVSWNGSDDGNGHAYLFVRVFANPSEEDVKALRAHFIRFILKTRANSNNQDEPVLRRFGDGLYIACDPTNFLSPGVMEKAYLGAEKDIEMIDFRPEDYGIAPLCR